MTLVPEDSALELAPIAARARGGWWGMGWATLDQAVSSCTNFGITVVAARQLSRGGFGAFGLAISVYIVVLGVARGLVTEPLLSRPELAHGDQSRAVVGAVVGAAFGVGCAVAVVALVAGLLLTRDAARVLIALAALLPVLCLQDAWRYCFISQGRPGAAIVNDGVWLAAQCATVTGLAVTHRWSAVSIMVAWGCAGATAGLVGLFQARAWPQPKRGWFWLRDQASLGARYCLEFVTANGATQLALVGLGAVAGLAALGSVRGAQAFFGPLGVLFNGVLLAVVPAATRLRATPRRLRRLIWFISGVMCAAAASWAIVGLALPGNIGRALFGESWQATRSVVLPIGLALVASGIASGPYAGLRALAAAKEGLRARLFSIPVLIGLPLAGAEALEARGFAYGLAAATLVMAAIYWRQFTVASERFAVPARAPSSGLLDQRSTGNP